VAATTNTYGDLIKELGMTRFSGIGYVLGSIDDVLKALGKKINQDIPTLNALVCGKMGFLVMALSTSTSNTHQCLLLTKNYMLMA
jgi:hypothetical protein